MRINRPYTKHYLEYTTSSPSKGQGHNVGTAATVVSFSEILYLTIQHLDTVALSIPIKNGLDMLLWWSGYHHRIICTCFRPRGCLRIVSAAVPPASRDIRRRRRLDNNSREPPPNTMRQLCMCLRRSGKTVDFARRRKNVLAPKPRRVECKR